jgi:hypothetical protein
MSIPKRPTARTIADCGTRPVQSGRVTEAFVRLTASG